MCLMVGNLMVEIDDDTRDIVDHFLLLPDDETGVEYKISTGVE